MSRKSIAKRKQLCPTGQPTKLQFRRVTVKVWRSVSLTTRPKTLILRKLRWNMILLECFIGLQQGRLKIVSLIETRQPWPSWTVMSWFVCLLTPTVLWSDYETWLCLLGLPISTTMNLSMWSLLDLLSIFEESGRHCKIYPRFLFLMWVYIL